MEFQIGDFVYVKIRPMKGIRKFGKEGKLRPVYIVPLEVVKRIGNSTYML